MKALLLASTLLFSSVSFAQKVCDLQENTTAFEVLDARFDNGELRGEDHAIARKELYESRLTLITDCLKKDVLEGIEQFELKDLVEFTQINLESYILDMQDSIQNSIDNDRIGMATELAYERDLEVAEVEVFIKKIKSLIKNPAK